MGNKQEELEVCACLQGCDLIGIMEMWWDGLYDWSVGGMGPTTGVLVGWLL